MKPTIGISMHDDGGRKVHDGVRYSLIRYVYGERVKAAGGRPIYFDASSDPLQAAQICDGIIIGGGDDIDPALYGGKPQKEEHFMEPRERTDWEYKLIAACNKKRIPIMGICYGVQLLNVYYGGTLCQDVPAEYGTEVEHHESHHEVDFEHSFLGFQKGTHATVASRHHQSVGLLGDGFHVTARSPDGVIEAIAGNGHFGLQWHAESDATAPRIYSAFIKACGRRSNLLPKAWAKSWQRVRSGSQSALLPGFKKPTQKD